MPVAEIEALDALQQLYGDINALIEHFLDKYEHAISTDHYSAICDMLETVDEERTVLQDETNELD